MVTHSSILAWETSRTKKLGGLQSTGLWRVGHNLAAEQTNKIQKGMYLHGQVM